MNVVPNVFLYACQSLGEGFPPACLVRQEQTVSLLVVFSLKRLNTKLVQCLVCCAYMVNCFALGTATCLNPSSLCWVGEKSVVRLISVRDRGHVCDGHVASSRTRGIVYTSRTGNRSTRCPGKRDSKESRGANGSQKLARVARVGASEKVPGRSRSNASHWEWACLLVGHGHAP